jgi:MYXO-CTERM domain-containing protein
MTAVALPRPQRTLQAVASRARAWRCSVRVAVLALTVVAFHIVDDSFLHPQPGTGAEDHLVSGLVPLGSMALAVWAYPRLRPGARAAIALSAGVLGLVVSVEAVYATLEGGGPSGDDFSGFAALPAGVALIAVGAATLWRSRRREGSLWRRSARRLLVLAGVVVLAAGVILPVGAAYLFTHIGRGVATNVDLGPDVEAITLRTSDGLTLTGSYVPSRNGAAVIVSPGYASTPDHARMLMRHGYGVLLFDQRGEGRSDGDPNAFGWSAEKDFNAAIAFLEARPDVDRGRIGGLGLSVAGETLLQTAAHNTALTAVVSEGAGNRSYREVRDMPGGPEAWLGMPGMVANTAAVAVFANETPPANLRHLVGDIAPRAVFLISAGHGVDSEVLNTRFYEAAGEPKTLWEIPEAGHTGGLEVRPREYEARVVGFFDRSLLPSPAGAEEARQR